jgi:hypothetical protein
MSENNQGTRGSHKVAIAAIIVAGIVILSCIVAFTAIAMAFVANAPW